MRWFLGVVVWFTVIGGGLTLLARHDSQISWVPQIRFAGVDAIYALRRVAGEADRVLMLDEVRARGTLGDLRFQNIDVDLRPGPIDDVMRQLQKAANGSFDFRIGDGTIYVRSNHPIETRTDLDTVLIPEAEFTGNFADLLKAFRAHDPRVFLRTAHGGGADLPGVSMKIANNSTLIEVLRQYGTEADVGWHLMRAGYVVKEDEKETAILPSTVRAWPRLERPRYLPVNRNLPSLAQALGSVTKRTGFPICVLDRTPIGVNRGGLDFEPFVDPERPAEESLDILARTDVYHFYDWEKVDGFGLVRSSHFTHYPVKTGFVSQKLRGGSFTGTLGDFARFLSRNRIEPTNEVVMAGEIRSDDPITSVEIAPGSTIEEALIEFAKASGACWYWVGVDRRDPLMVPIPQRLPDHSFVGAFLSQTAYWAEGPGF